MARFNDKIKALVHSKHEEITRALSGRGMYHFVEEYSYFAVDTEVWLKMRPDQRRKIVKDFEKSALSDERPRKVSRRLFESHCSTIGTDSDTPVQHQSMCLPARTLSVSVEESGISTLSLVTLRMMWNKADKQML